MKLAVYFFIIAQILNFLGAFAEKVIKSSSKFDSIKWEKVKENKSKTLKKIIWKSYKNDKSDLENKIFKNKPKKNQEKTEKETSTWRNRILRFSFEEIDMPDAGEHMGLYSIGAYDRLNPWLYGGITLYGAASGQRGGFFTGGYTLGVEHWLTEKLILDAGGYVGAGGGGAAAQGGGLHIRPHVGIKYDFSWSTLGLNYTYVDFPNGNISSDAVALSLDFPFSSPIFNWEDDGLTVTDYFGSDLKNVSRHRSHISARARAYSPASASKTTTGRSLDNSLGLVGVEYSYFLDEYWFATFETAGAISGGVGGYAELLAGLGYRLPLTKNDRWALLPALTIGGAGGGAVETGGGFVARTNLGLEYRLSPYLSLIIDGGYLTAPGGNFDTSYAGFNLAYVMENFAKDQRGFPITETEPIKTTKWRFGKIRIKCS